MEEALEIKIKEALGKRGYQKGTVSKYFGVLNKLFDYYSGIPPLKITSEQVTKYALALKRRKMSTSSLRDLKYACEFFYTEMNGIDHGIYAFRLPQDKTKDVELFTQEEILKLIESKSFLKHKAIITLMYSCGLSASDIERLKHDCIVKSTPRILKVYDKSDKLIRKVRVPDQILPLLREYFEEAKPTKWFFYAQEGKDKPYKSTTKMIKDSIKAIGLSKELSSKSIRLSYIKHLTELGTPLINILIDYDLKGRDTFEEYSRLMYGTTQIQYSPIERKIDYEIKETIFDDLENLVFKVDSQIESDYLMEGITCFRAGAKRAGVIFIWSAAMYKIQEQIISDHNFKTIYDELKKIDPKAKQIKRIESFQHVSDENTLILCEKLGIYDKQEKNELSNVCLGLRNRCGHPTKYNPQPQRVKSYVENIMNIVYKQ